MEQHWKFTEAPADFARSSAHSIACAEKSTASTLHPRLAKWVAFRPCPHPSSSTRPGVRRPSLNHATRFSSGIRRRTGTAWRGPRRTRSPSAASALQEGVEHLQHVVVGVYQLVLHLLSDRLDRPQRCGRLWSARALHHLATPGSHPVPGNSVKAWT